MIDITPFQKRLCLLKEFMDERIDLKALSYGFKQWVWIDNDPKTYDMSNFEDYCFIKTRELCHNT